jgi:AbrB family looped-hinge helix DNA binding protein
MEMVKVSPKYQAVISKRLREQLQLKPGEELQAYVLDGTIRLHRPRSRDAFLYAAARSAKAEFVTSDAHFQGLPGVTFL